MLITLLNQNGGCGKSTLTVHLAAWLAERGANLAVLDCDPQQCTKSWLEQAAPGLLVRTPLTASDVRESLSELLPALDAVIADSKPGLDPTAIELARQSDLIVMPIIPSGVNIRGTEQAIITLDELGIFKQKGDGVAIAALNMVDSRSAQTEKAKRRMKMLGVSLASHHIGHRLIFRAAYDAGVIVSKLPIKNPGFTVAARAAAQELDTLFNEIVPHGLRNYTRTEEGSTEGGNPTAGECGIAEAA